MHTKTYSNDLINNVISARMKYDGNVGVRLLTGLHCDLGAMLLVVSRVMSRHIDPWSQERIGGIAEGSLRHTLNYKSHKNIPSIIYH